MKQSFPGYIFVHLPENSAEDRLLDLSIPLILNCSRTLPADYKSVEDHPIKRFSNTRSENLKGRD
jgi:hypothetical protein